MVALTPVKPPSFRSLLPWVVLLILAISRGSVAFIANCRRSNCQFNVKDECQRSVRVYCIFNQPIKKINITKTYFPEHVQEITISNVREMDIQANAIVSLASLETIELSQIGTLNLLPRSMARTKESRPISVTIQDVKSLQLHPKTFADWLNSGSRIIIRRVGDCHMPQKTIAPSTLIHSLQLVRITTLIIGHDAFAADSVVENMWLSNVKTLTVETGAFAPNSIVQFMELGDIKSLKLHTGAFAQNSTIHNATVDRVASLLIASGGIQADISELTVRDVSMPTCENNTFGNTIQNMLLTSSHINLTKSGCISACAGWTNLLVENSKLDHVESLAISGTIDQVQIKDSVIGTVDAGGFTLNATRFLVEGSTIGELSEKALTVFAAEVITLRKCKVAILRKHAFSLLQLNPSAKDGIIIENLHIQVMENKSMQFPPGTNLAVLQLELGIPCTCNMENLVLELGLPSRMQPGHEDDPETSRWLEQTRCVSNTTTPTLAEYHREYCPDPTSTLPPTTITSGLTDTGRVIMSVLIGMITAALLLIAVAALLVRQMCRQILGEDAQPIGLHLISTESHVVAGW